MTNNAIKPGQPVLHVALPVPADAVTLLVDVVERLYGTGESTLRYSEFGDSLVIAAPKDGFGPRLRTPMPEPVDSEGVILSAKGYRNGIDLTLEQSAETVAVVSAALAQWFELNGGINYVTATLVSRQDPDARFSTTVRRVDAPTPEELHLAAKDRVAVLEQQLRDNGIEPVEEA